MSKNFNKSDVWKEQLEKFSSYEGTVTDFCKENKLSKSQFYYHKKRLDLPKTTAFHAIKFNKENTVGEIINTTVSKDIKIKIGKATIFIPLGEVAILSDVVKELIKTC